jgi:hypothetical protein
VADTEPAAAGPLTPAAAPTSGGARNRVPRPARLQALLELLPWWRHRQCERGERTCYECAAYARYFAPLRPRQP